MARLAKDKPAKKPRGIVLAMMREQAMNNEPIFNRKPTNLELIQAFGWYSENCDVNQARKFLNAFLDQRDERALIVELQKVPDFFFPLTAAWIARLLAKGAKLDDFMIRRLYQRIDEAIDRIELDLNGNEKRRPVTNKISPMDRTVAKADAIMVEIEGLLDDDRTFSLYDLLHKHEYPKNLMNRVFDRFSLMRDEILLAIKRKDDQIVEAYGGYNNKELNELLAFYNRMLNEATRYSSNSAMNTKIRKNKIKNAGKKLDAPQPSKKNESPVQVTDQPKPVNTSGIKYLPKYDTHKLVSIDPNKIIGANEIWTYNPKYEFITVIRAQKGAVLGIKGSTIINVDTNTSVTKRIGKKAGAYLDRIKVSGKAEIDKMMSAVVAAPCTLQTRMNENTVIIKVF